MPNRNLTAAELVKANTLLSEIRRHLTELSGGDSQPCSPIAVQIEPGRDDTCDERGTPAAGANSIPAFKRGQLGHLCAVCSVRSFWAERWGPVGLMPTLVIQQRILGGCRPMRPNHAGRTWVSLKRFPHLRKLLCKLMWDYSYLRPERTHPDSRNPFKPTAYLSLSLFPTT